MKMQNGFSLFKILSTLVLLVILTVLFLGSFGEGIYGRFYAKQISGDIVSVKSINAVLHGNKSTFSATVLLKTHTGELVTFTSEDRTWQQFLDWKYRGNCVLVTVMPYPPWNFSNSGKLHGGYLQSIMNKPCNS